MPDKKKVYVLTLEENGKKYYFSGTRQKKLLEGIFTDSLSKAILFYNEVAAITAGGAFPSATVELIA